MRYVNAPVGRTMRCAIVALALTFSACSSTIPAPEQRPKPEPVQIEILQTPIEPIVVVPKHAAKLPVPPRLPPVAILLSGNQPAYADVATALAQRFDDSKTYNLGDDDRPPVTILQLINDSDSRVVVAIGLRAAESAIALSEQPVVFSQVFNYQDHELLTENSRGIAAMAPLDAQIAAWKEADPMISRIGAIIGEGHEALIVEAEVAAARHNIDLRLQVTRSDQETSYVFKRMVRDIDGFWLFPDNRILSQRALQQIVQQAHQLQVPLMVPSEQMLQLGGTISVDTVAADIAATITGVVRRIIAGELDLVPPISPLSAIRVTTNKPIRVVKR